MTIILIILGIIIGGATAAFMGAIAGGMMGFVLGSVISLKKSVDKLRVDLDLIKNTQQDKVAIKTQPEVSNTPKESGKAVTTTEPASETKSIVAADYKAQAPHIEEPIPQLHKKVVEEKAVGKNENELSESNKDVPSNWGDQSHSSGISSGIDPFEWIKKYFTGGNTLVRVGVIILFFGVAFLLKYAAERNVLPIEYRLAGVAMGAIVMLVLGWRLRHSREKYALALQGGAVGVLYLTVFAALRLYELIPPGFAFAILFICCLLSAVLAITQNSLSLAVLGTAGGFLAPILTSSGSGDHVMLFSYYVLLNTGIVFIAWFKRWRLLNLVGFAFTFIIGSSWGFLRYNAELFSTTEPFLIIFFLYYTIISILFSLKRPEGCNYYIDNTLVFGTPIVAFGLQHLLVKPYEYGLVYSAIVLALFYLTIATVLFKRFAGTEMLRSIKLFCESYLAIGVIFITAAVPLALSDKWTASAWALEGLAVVWAGFRQQRKLPLLFGVLLELGSGYYFIKDYSVVKTIAVFNGTVLGGILISLAGILTAYLFYRNKDKSGEYYNAHIALLIWGLCWWVFTGINEIKIYVDNQYFIACILLFFSYTAFACYKYGAQLKWRDLQWPSRGLIIVMAYGFIASIASFEHPFVNIGSIGWLVCLLTYLWILKQYDEDELSPAMEYFHSAWFWVMTALVTWEMAWHVGQWMSKGVWSQVVWVLPAIIIMMVLNHFHQKLLWPINKHHAVYTFNTLIPFAVFMALWGLVMNLTSTGNPWPLPYIPLINPLDIVIAFVFLVLIDWFFSLKQKQVQLPADITPQRVYGLLAVMLFIWVNAILVRTVHYWGGIPFNIQSMFGSDLVQASISILWSVLALLIMVVSSRKHWRLAWVIGSVLLAAVVVKLFIIELSNTGTIERIVSFLGVGILMLIIGYMSPIPPKSLKEEVA